MPRSSKRDPTLKSPESPFVQRDQWAKWIREAASPEYAAKAFAVFNSAGHVSRQVYLERMADMGWTQEAHELSAWYYKRGLQLKEFRRVV